MVVEVKRAKVVVWLWPFGNDVGGGGLVVVGGRGDRGCGDGGMVGVVVKESDVVIWLLRYGWSKITIEKEKWLPQRVAAW